VQLQLHVQGFLDNVDAVAQLMMLLLLLMMMMVVVMMMMMVLNVTMMMLLLLMLMLLVMQPHRSQSPTCSCNCARTPFMWTQSHQQSISLLRPIVASIGATPGGTRADDGSGCVAM
jgi:hypothetical protein